MKKVLGLIFLALGLSSLMFTGSVSIVEGTKPVRTIDINVIQINSLEEIYSPSASFDFANYGTWGCKYQWYMKGPEYGDQFLPYGDIQYVWFDGRQTSGVDINLPLPDGPEYNMFNSFKVDVWLLKKNGNYVHGFEPAKPAEPEPWMSWDVDVGGPSINIITFIPNSPSPGYYQPTCSFSFGGYKAWGYKYQWYKGPSGAKVPISEIQYVWFDGWQTSGTNLFATGPDSQTLTGRYSVEVWLINNAGNEISDAWITAGIGFF